MTTPMQAMRNLLDEDKRYKLDAYQFIREALQYAQEDIELCEEIEAAEALSGPGNPMPKHVTGQQLCEACRRYALEQYGYLAKIVLESWGIVSTGDFGELVYNLIRIEQMRKSETDRREDFDDVYSFDEAFEPNFEFVPRDEE